MGHPYPFSYSPLGYNQIRLFKLDLNENDAPLSGSIITFRLLASEDFSWKSIFSQLSSSDAWHNTEFAESRGATGFDALSYVWGSSDRIYPLNLTWTGKAYTKYKLRTDGSVLGRGTIGIQHNLFTLLQHLRRVKYDRFIWIDSICIDQKTQAEKGAQIPFMRHIYREANNVLVWLGEASQLEEGAMTIIPAVTAKLKQAKVDNRDFHLNADDPQTFEAIGLPEPGHPVWRAMGSIMNRPYFRRLWTLQEVVLPRRDSINILCGGRQISWEVLSDFGFTVALGFKELVNWTITGNQFVGPDAIHGYTAVRLIKGIRAVLTESLKSVLGGGVRLAYLLLATRQREASNPTDKIFGMMGMAEQGLGKLLGLDISMSPIEVFVAFARHYLRHEVVECLLNHVASRDRMPGLPSWCPNFGSVDRTCSIGSFFLDDLVGEETPNSRRYHAGFEQDFANIPRNNFSYRRLFINLVHRRRNSHGDLDTPDLRQLTLLNDPYKIRAVGMPVDVITQIVPYNAGIENFTTSVDAIRQTFEWEILCRSLAIHIFDAPDDAVPEAYWRVLIANQVCAYVGEECIVWDSGNKIDLSRHYHIWTEYMQQCIRHNKPLPLVNPQGPAHDLWFCTQVPRMMRQRSFFATRNGRLGIGPKTVEVGDEVVVFFYCPTPYVLRRREASYEFVGETYVHGLMYAEALRMLERGEVREQSYILR